MLSESNPVVHILPVFPNFSCAHSLSHMHFNIHMIYFAINLHKEVIYSSHLTYEHVFGMRKWELTWLEGECANYTHK